MTDNLYFANPVFEEGLNLTVRRGTKWGIATGRIPIYKTGDNTFVGYAEIVGVKTMRFMDIKDSDIKSEHDPTCRNYEGLLAAMKEVYENFDEREIVCLLYFEYSGLYW